MGILQQLAAAGELDWLSPQRDVQVFAGTSVGALFALLSYAKVDLFSQTTAKKVQGFLQTLQWKPDAFVHDFLSRDVYSVKTPRLGLGTGCAAVEYLEQLLLSRFRRRHLTLQQLHYLVGGELILVATCARTCTPIYFSYKTHPDVCVTDAAFASMALPFLFQPFCVRSYQVDCDGPVETKPVESKPVADASKTPVAEAATGPVWRVRTSIHPSAYACNQDLDERAEYAMNSTHEGADGEREDADGEREGADCERVIYACLDGCFVDNNPFAQIPTSMRTLNLTLARCEAVDLTSQSWMGFTQHVLSVGVRRVEVLQEVIARTACACRDRDVITVDVSPTISSSAQFDLSEQELETMLEHGRRVARAFLTRQHAIPT